jgi:hypothetical protein
VAEVDPDKALQRLQQTLNSASEFLSRDLARAERIRQNWGVSNHSQNFDSKTEEQTDENP